MTNPSPRNKPGRIYHWTLCCRASNKRLAGPFSCRDEFDKAWRHHAARRRNGISVCLDTSVSTRPTDEGVRWVAP